MKMKRYQAKDMRQALTMIRAEQGPEAVILSSRRIAGGVEVCAAIDYDFSEVMAAQVPVAAREEKWQPSLPDPEPALAGLSAQTDGVSDEIRSLRRLLETQVAALAWNDYTRRHPLKARVLQELTNVGVSRELAWSVLDELPDQFDSSQATRLPLALLARRITTTTSLAFEHGGIVALVGPHGVGKTTTIAKLATRWVLDRGPRDIALISMDRDRFGSQEQLQALGRLLGVQTFVADDMESLAALLDQLGERRLVLIDTPGLNPRSERLPRELGALPALRPGIEIGLVLAASAQAGALDEAMERYALLRPNYCLLTRLDDAPSLGGALSALARSNLPLAWLSGGPRVPEDLEPARSHQLVARAVSLARKAGATADEDLLARRFGGLIHAAA
jgi:flagellar biosynthesis protein FlhF